MLGITVCGLLRLLTALAAVSMTGGCYRQAQPLSLRMERQYCMLS